VRVILGERKRIYKVWFVKGPEQQGDVWLLHATCIIVFVLGIWGTLYANRAVYRTAEPLEIRSEERVFDCAIATSSNY